MSFFVPANVRETALSWGEDGARWLDGLPMRVTELEREWSLTVLPALDTETRCSWVAPARLEDGSDAILKIGIPHREARCEADALRAYDGRGAVRLLRASEESFSLLLERCVPGTDLWTLGEDESDAAGAEVLRRLWREPPPEARFETVEDLALEWAELLPREGPALGYDEELITRAVEKARQLAASQPRKVLVHGDFHPGNVLAAERDPWLAIDPKPLVGDPAYDLAQWLGNRCEAARRTPDPASVLRRQIDRFGDLLDLAPDRIAGWAFVKSLGWEWDPREARLLLAAMDR